MAGGSLDCELDGGVYGAGGMREGCLYAAEEGL